MSYTLSYDDSGFSDVTASPLEAKFTSEYESGLKSMFLQDSSPLEEDEETDNATLPQSTPVVLTVNSDTSATNNNNFITSTPRATRPIQFHKSLKSEFEAYSDGNSRNSSQERDEDEYEEDEELGDSMFDSPRHHHSTRPTLTIRHRRTTTNTTDSISESDDHHNHMDHEEHEEDAVFASCSCPKCHQTVANNTFQTNQRKAYSVSTHCH